MGVRNKSEEGRRCAGEGVMGEGGAAPFTHTKLVYIESPD